MTKVDIMRNQHIDDWFGYPLPSVFMMPYVTYIYILSILLTVTDCCLL